MPDRVEPMRLGSHEGLSCGPTWSIHEWPHSRALGERWFARPLNVPADQPWPGVHWFVTEQEAREFGDGHKDGE